MQQLTLTENRNVEWLEVPAPRLQGPGEAIVRPIAVALCDLDQPTIRGETPIPGPIALGHESIAEVVEVGEGVSTVAPGDLVVVPFQISCGECERCRAGLTGNCLAVPERSMYGFGPVVGGDWGGALSDLLRVPYADAMLLPLPDGIEPEHAASLCDNVADGYRTVAPQLERAPGAAVLIVAGAAHSISLYALQTALALGAAGVSFVDDDDDRLAKAAELGATPVEAASDVDRAAYPITVDGSASKEGLALALRSTEPGGWCTSVGIIYEPEVPLPLLEMYGNGVNFHIGRAMSRATLPAVLDLVAAGSLAPERVTSRVTTWDRAPEAVLEPETKLIITR
jgi:alcohol dehydrogenase